MRECNHCKQIGRIARQCPKLPRTPLPPPPATRPQATRVDGLAAHKTDGEVCSACKKPGQVEAQCWATHPEQLPADLLKKRQAAMSAGNRKRRKAAEYTSPGYVFQGMALTYNRTSTMMQRRSTRTPQPTRQAVESFQQRPARRVQFAPSILSRPASILASTEDPLTTPSAPVETQEEPGVPNKYAYKERLPQSFPHGLPPSSLEPGTSDQQYPPSQLFPEPPMGDQEDLLM